MLPVLDNSIKDKFNNAMDQEHNELQSKLKKELKNVKSSTILFQILVENYVDATSM